MIKTQLIPFSAFLLVLMTFMACQQEQATPVLTTSTPDEYAFDQVYQNQLGSIRLGDGVPLTLDLSIRWKVEDCDLFRAQFSSTDSYNKSILLPRASELANNVSNSYGSVDSVFTSQRQLYLSDIKNELLKNLGEEGIRIKEVILAKIIFPSNYTNAMEQAGLQRQELERIKQQNISDIAKAEANRKKAEANGKVDIAKAEAAGKLQKIQAETEKSRRAIELAKAETQNQVAKMQTQAEAERRQVLAAADIETKRAVKNLDVQKVRELDQLAIQKEQQLEENKLKREIKFAELCSQNPVYASYLVNKELASKVKIAVLPSNSDENVFSSIIDNVMPSMKTTKQGFVPQ